MSAPDYREIRDSVGAIGLAVSMLRLDDASWLRGLAPVEQSRIRAVLTALHSATEELVGRVAPDARAIAVETARALAARSASPAQSEAIPAADVGVSAHLSTVLRRLEITAAIETPPRPLLSLRLDCNAVVAACPKQLHVALHAAVIGLARSRPQQRQPWTVSVAASEHVAPDGAPLVVVELRCELFDKSPSRGGADVDATLPPWLHECLRLTDVAGGDLSRGRDGVHERVRVTLPACLSATEVESAANDDPGQRSQAVA